MGVEPSLRYRRVRITGTRYQPLDVESQIREAVNDNLSVFKLIFKYF